MSVIREKIGQYRVYHRLAGTLAHLNRLAVAGMGLWRFKVLVASCSHPFVRKCRYIKLFSRGKACWSPPWPLVPPSDVRPRSCSRASLAFKLLLFVLYHQPTQGLQISVTKSATIPLTRRSMDQRPLTKTGQCIVTKRQHLFLGIVIDWELTSTHHVDNMKKSSLLSFSYTFH